MDAHADFYEPEKSTTGEVADMNLAIVTGRGPEILTNINHLKSYVAGERVIHIGQRDCEQTKTYGLQDIRNSGIKCVSLEEINKKDTATILADIIEHAAHIQAEGYWIRFNTDVLDHAINPAVDYRLSGGLLQTVRIAGMSITIYNPLLDESGEIGKNIATCIGNMFALQ